MANAARDELSSPFPMFHNESLIADGLFHFEKKRMKKEILKILSKKPRPSR